MKQTKTKPEGRKEFRRMRVLTVDPGLGGTGLAFWSPGNLPKPYLTGILKANGKKDYLDRAALIVRHFRAYLGSVYPDLVVIENQAVWDDSEEAYASSRKGDIIKLAHLAGMLALAVMEAGKRVEMIAVAKWKGQLPKQAVNSRIKRVTGDVYADHISDAVGIGLSMMELI